MSVLSDWTSCLTPALTRSSRPTRFSFFPFPFSSAIAILFSAHVAAGVLPPPARRSSAVSLILSEILGLLIISFLPPPRLLHLGDTYPDPSPSSHFHTRASPPTPGARPRS